MKKTYLVFISALILTLSFIFALVPNAATPSTVSGTLKDHYGAIIPNCTVAAYYDGGDKDGQLAASALTGADGSYTLTLDNGDYEITYYGTGSYIQTLSVNVGGNMTLNITSQIKLSIRYPDKVQVGDIFTIDVVVSNYTDTALPACDFTITEPTLIKILTDTAFTFPSTPADKTQTVSFKAVALVGGSENLLLKDADGIEYVEEIFISGPGYYGGDAHTHSNYYDGTGTISENVAAARAMGLDWLYSTDHNMLMANLVAGHINASANGRFLNLVGSEITIFGYSGVNKDTGHVLAYRIDAIPEGYPAPGAYTESRNRVWSDTINGIKQQGGIAYIAHPYNELIDYNNNGKGYDYGYWMSDYEKYTITNMNGVEVINWFDHKDFKNRAAFKYWDELNAKGEQTYFGSSNTDSHASKYIGMVYNKGYLDSLTIENVNGMFENGRFYGSNGPDIRFEIDGVDMGNILYVTQPTTVRVHVQAYDSRSYLKNITIYKLQTTGDWLGAETKEVSKFINLDGQNLNFFDGYFEMELRPGEIYRMEAKSQFCHHPIIRVANHQEGFAFSNPIWIKQSNMRNATVLSSVNYSGNGSLVSTDYEIPYIVIAEGSFNMNNLTVTVGADTTYTANYTNGSAGKAGQLTITLTAADGSQRIVTYLVVSSAFA